MIESKIEALLTGKPKKFYLEDIKSSIARQSQSGPIMLREEGLDGDEVADRMFHGGPDKALHLYPAEHYPFWSAQLDGHPLLEKKGAFGENISASGLTEEIVKIGDRFRMGNAVVEVSHGRQPCWKIDHRFGVKGMSRTVIKSGRCGLYFRVLEEGEVAAGDRLEQIEAAQHDWNVQQVFLLLFGGAHREEGAAEQLAELSKLPLLAEVWQERAQTLLKE